MLSELHLNGVGKDIGLDLHPKLLDLVVHYTRRGTEKLANPVFAKESSGSFENRRPVNN